MKVMVPISVAASVAMPTCTPSSRPATKKSLTLPTKRLASTPISSEPARYKTTITQSIAAKSTSSAYASTRKAFNHRRSSNATNHSAYRQRARASPLAALLRGSAIRQHLFGLSAEATVRESRQVLLRQPRRRGVFARSRRFEGDGQSFFFQCAVRVLPLVLERELLGSRRVAGAASLQGFHHQRGAGARLTGARRGRLCGLFGLEVFGRDAAQAFRCCGLGCGRVSARRGGNGGRGLRRGRALLEGVLGHDGPVQARADGGAGDPDDEQHRQREGGTQPAQAARLLGGGVDARANT